MDKHSSAHDIIIYSNSIIVTHWLVVYIQYLISHSLKYVTMPMLNVIMHTNVKQERVHVGPTKWLALVRPGWSLWYDPQH